MNMGLIPEERAGRFSLKVVPEQARRVRGFSKADTEGRELLSDPMVNADFEYQMGTE
jgi:hypothetical protein